MLLINPENKTLINVENEIQQTADCHGFRPDGAIL